MFEISLLEGKKGFTLYQTYMYQEDHCASLDLLQIFPGGIVQNCPLLARRIQKAKFRGELIQPRPPGYGCVSRIATTASLFAAGNLNHAGKHL